MGSIPMMKERLRKQGQIPVRSKEDVNNHEMILRTEQQLFNVKADPTFKSKLTSIKRFLKKEVHKCKSKYNSNLLIPIIVSWFITP